MELQDWWGYNRQSWKNMCFFTKSHGNIVFPKIVFFSAAKIPDQTATIPDQTAKIPDRLKNISFATPKVVLTTRCKVFGKIRSWKRYLSDKY